VSLGKVFDRARDELRQATWGESGMEIVCPILEAWAMGWMRAVTESPSREVPVAAFK